MDLGPSQEPIESNLNTRSEATWIQPIPDPAVVVESNETTRLALVAALQHLPPKQRAVLILCEVLRWKASEVAELLDTSVASVNSALQRARETLETRADALRDAPPDLSDAETTSLLARYVQAWEQADIGVLVSLLREDATLAMPPFASWFQGADAIARSIGDMVFTSGARGTYRLVATRANGQPAFAAYTKSGAEWRATAIHVLRIEGGRIAAIDAFLDPSLFRRFGLPDVLPA